MLRYFWGIAAGVIGGADGPIAVFVTAPLWLLITAGFAGAAAIVCGVIAYRKKKK